MMYGSSESSISSQMLIMYLKIAILVCVCGGVAGGGRMLFHYGFSLYFDIG